MGDAFQTAVYLLCFLTSSACAVLLARNYLRTRARLLMWSAICFGFLGLNNLIVVFDLLIVRDLSLQIPRVIASAIAAAVLLFGLIWDLES